MAEKPTLVQRRFQEKNSAKIRDLAERSASGSMSGFQGVFQVARADEQQAQQLAQCLAPFSPESGHLPVRDIEQLTQLLLEVQAISHQALLLHGERIRRAQQIMRAYREGAFSAWLIQAYGNRQTPYNLLKYYEFYHVLPKSYQARVESLPKQMVYQLASRQNPLSQKLALLDQLAHHPKRDYLPLLRRELPLPSRDGRKSSSSIYRALARIRKDLQVQRDPLPQRESQRVRAILAEIEILLHKNHT